MSYETIISAADLLHQLDNPEWAILDCRFFLEDPDRGQIEYQTSHIPGALYADLERDLCGKNRPADASRHPFPSPEAFVKKCSDWGIDEDVQVVIYDNFSGGFAVRLWRMLGWAGHHKVALLNGGWDYWRELGHPTQSQPENRAVRSFSPKFRPELIMGSAEAYQLCSSKQATFIDARSQASYSGRKGPSPVQSGHIPGASHFHFEDHVDERGLFLPDRELRARYKELIGEIEAENVICYCTSGVTAALNILVMQHLGLGEARLYAGSWDEWSSHAAYPIEKTEPT